MREDFQHVILESNKLAFAGRTDDALGFVVQSLGNAQEKLTANPKQFLFLFHHCLRIQSTDPKHSDSAKHLQILKFGASIPGIAPLLEFADDYYCGRITANEATSHQFAPEHRFETYAFYQQILGECHQKGGQYFKAIQCFELAIELDPYWYPAYLNLSDCNLKLGLQKKE